MEYSNNIHNLFNICYKNDNFLEKVRMLNDYIKDEYPMLDYEVEKKLGYNICNDSYLNIKNEIIKLLNHLLQNNNEYLEELNYEYQEKINDIVVLIYNYLSDRIDFKNIKFSIYLLLFNIDYKDFYNLSFNATVTLIELKNYNVNIKELAGMGNFQIVLIGEIANGAFPSKEHIRIVGQLAQIIDECLDSGEMYEMELDDDSLIFEPLDEELLSIYLYSNVEDVIVVVNNDNEFVQGNINDLLQLFKIMPVQQTYGLDNIIKNA